MNEAERHVLSSDSPIICSDEDQFGRDRLAARIAAEARTAPADAGFVIALCGAWGTGKTSIANLAIERLRASGDTRVVPFNPWMFSGTEDLVERFFGELAATLSKEEGKLRAVASRIASYAGALTGVAGLVPSVGTTASSVLAAAERVMLAAGEAPTLHQRRQDLAQALAEFDGRIVVFLDDLDRLTDEEIRQIVKLVKLVGDLPRITYLLSFDRGRVEQALGSPEIAPEVARERGRAYLEKIVQSRHDVPALRATTAISFFQRQIASTLEPYGDRHVHDTDWANMLGLSLRHMVRTPRDAKRVANALPAAMDLYGDEVAVVDLIALETLRALEPDVHAGLAGVADILVDDRLVIGDNERQREEDRQRINVLLDAAQELEPTKALMRQLFPRAQRALGDARAQQSERTERTEMRVAVPSVFRAYLHATLDDDTLASADIERLIRLLPQPDELRQALDQLDNRFLDDAIGRLLDYSDQFRPEFAVGAAMVLVDLERRLPEDQSPIFTGRTPSSWQLHSLVGHLLLSQPDLTQRAAMAAQLVDEAPNLSARLRVLNWFGTYPARESRDPDSEMIDEVTTQRLVDDLRQRVAGATPDTLMTERALPRLLAGLLDPDPDTGRPLVVEKAEHDGLMLALLRALYGERQAQSVGEAAVRRTPRIGWKSLVELVGDEWLRSRVVGLADAIDRDQLDEQTVAALELAASIGRGDSKPDPDF